MDERAGSKREKKTRDRAGLNSDSQDSSESSGEVQESEQEAELEGEQTELLAAMRQMFAGLEK